MTAATVATRPTESRPPGVTAGRVLNSEWIKLRTLRSTWFGYGVIILFTVGLGYLLAVDSANHANFAGDTNFDTVQACLQGLYLAPIGAAALGILFVTGEYHTGMIRASFTAVPRRQAVLLAKVAVFAAATFVVALVASTVAFLLGQLAMNRHHLGVSLTSPGAAQAVLIGALFLVIIGLLGVGCGWALRRTAAAIVTPLGILVVLPTVASAFGVDVTKHIGKYLPVNAASQLTQTKNLNPQLLAPWAGLGVLALYAAAALVIGAIVLRRRDA